MSKIHCILVTLLNKGALISDLHYEPFSHYWWQSSDNEKVFPICIGQRIVTHLNGHDFYVEIVHGNKENCHLPGYSCETKDFLTFRGTTFKNGGTGYQSSLIYKYKKKHSLFVSTIEDNVCIIKVYHENELIDSLEGTSPIEVWKKTNYIQKYDGYQLFGLDNIIVQNFIKKHKVSKSMPDE
ncbi:9477_t:CDS:2 [Entrophospora sp. SA101]|nr:14936_t:CDS:2 [Entrophospora sp. SA101]CAJ0853793.1 9477_t:CDS:2 [Entrophospora sp. SA101]